MRLEESRPDCRNDCEEGDGWLRGRRTMAVGVEEGGSEASPDVRGMEWIHHFDAGAGHEGCNEGVDHAVDVVEW